MEFKVYDVQIQEGNAMARAGTDFTQKVKYWIRYDMIRYLF